MSINVTVNGNPISIRRGKMVLSDLENVKKTEREHRKRLRLEQVNEQSKALSKTLLERARQVRQEQLDRLEKCGNTEMRRARDKKLMELHSRYQDIENIGYAHANAARQPDVQCIKEAEEQRNQEKAKKREAEALERIKEAQKKISPHTKHVERLRSVRELENERSNMVSRLPKKPAASINIGEPLEHQNTTKSKSPKYIVTKKTPIKKPKINSKTPSKISVSIPKKDKTMTNSCVDKNKKLDTNKHNTASNLDQINARESDENEPRKIVPKTVPSQPKRVLRIDIEKKNSNLISSPTTSSSSSSISEDSSYFSDNASKSTLAKKASKQQLTCSTSSKVVSYDHETRHKHSYDRPDGLVQRMNDKNKPNANDLAQEMVNLENQVSDVLITQEETSNQRGQDALLRQKIRNDYSALLKKLDELSKKEKKYEAEQCSMATNQRLSAPSKRNEDLANRQRKMDRVFKNILQDSRQPINTDLIDRAERPITILPLENLNYRPLSASRYRALFSDDDETDESPLENENDYTQKIRISELLIKLEKMKRRLLKEYGPDLPHGIFNASVESLFNNQPTSICKDRTEAKSLKPTPAPQPKPKVIKSSNVTCTNRCNKPVTKPFQKTVSKTKNVTCKTPAKNISISTNKNVVSTCDQEIQVTLEQERKDKEVETIRQYPLEPEVKIVMPNSNHIDSHSSTSICSSNSSVSTDVVIGVSKKELTIISKDKKRNMRVSKNTTSISSVQSTSKTPVKICFDEKNGNESYQIVGLVIDTSMKEITVIPKKSKLTTELKDASPVITGSCHSLPGSRSNSPSKKQSTSAPPSRHSSPKKSSQPHQHVRTRPCSRERKFRTQYTQVSNSSTESSQLNSSETNNFYRYQATASKRIITQIQDSSDASTAYPSPLEHGILNASDNTNTILEFLDSSTNESLKKRLQDVSPVSSPETPSPRTMMVPSNIPRSGRASKSLKFTSLINTQPQTGSSSNFKRNRPCPTINKKTAAQSRPCNCQIRDCKFFHDRREDSQISSLKYCPEMLKKYEDMQNVCADRIASINNLLQHVRNEQDKELSMITSKDSNSASQIISSSQLSSNGDQVVKKAESVCTQLKKTLMVSRQIISGGGVKLCESLKDNKDKLSPMSKNTSSLSDSTEEKVKKNQQQHSDSAPSNKPKIVCNEKVNIDLDRFKPAPKPNRTSGGSDDVNPVTTSIGADLPTGNSSDQNKDAVEILSKEILEQSKSLNKSPNDILKNVDDSSFKTSQPVMKDSGESNENAADNQKHDPSENLNNNGSEFVPFLAGIPKILRTKSSSSSGRQRPPVTLISGPYRQEMDLNSSVHELSTIVEFDTPDTAKKSQVSTRSPSNKARKKLPTDSNQSSPSKKSDLVATKSKPSVHVAPLPAHKSPQLSLNTSKKSGTQSFEKSPRNTTKKSAEKLSELSENKKAIKSILKKSNSSDSMHSLPDVLIENLQTSRENTDANYDFRISQISELHSLPDENIDQMLVSGVCEETIPKTDTPKKNRERVEEQKKNQLKKAAQGLVLSSSSTSFSGLSGVSEITTSPSSELNTKCFSSPEEMEQALKKWGIGGWATATLKKTREASALGSSSSSDGTPVNTGTRLASPIKKQHQDGSRDLPAELSDVSSISMKHANKSTEKSLLVKGRTSTPNKLEKNESQNKFSITNSDGTVSTLGSFSSDLNIVADNHSVDMTVPNISFSNCKL